MYDYELTLNGKVFFFTENSLIEIYEENDEEDVLITKIDPMDLIALLSTYKAVTKEWYEYNKEEKEIGGVYY